MKIDIQTIVHRIDPVLAMAKSITVLSSYWLGSLLTEHVHPESRLMGAMLAAISSIVVLQMATITLVVILVISKQSPSLPPVINDFLRFFEATVGAIISISIAYGIECFKRKISHSRKQR